MPPRNSPAAKKLRREERARHVPFIHPGHPSGLNGKTRRTVAKLLSLEVTHPGFKPAVGTDPMALAILEHARKTAPEATR